MAGRVGEKYLGGGVGGARLKSSKGHYVKWGAVGPLMFGVVYSIAHGAEK